MLSSSPVSAAAETANPSCLIKCQNDLEVLSNFFNREASKTNCRSQVLTDNLFALLAEWNIAEHAALQHKFANKLQNIASGPGSNRSKAEQKRKANIRYHRKILKKILLAMHKQLSNAAIEKESPTIARFARGLLKITATFRLSLRKRFERLTLLLASYDGLASDIIYSQALEKMESYKRKQDEMPLVPRKKSKTALLNDADRTIKSAAFNPLLSKLFLAKYNELKILLASQTIRIGIDAVMEVLNSDSNSEVETYSLPLSPAALNSHESDQFEIEILDSESEEEEVSTGTTPLVGSEPTLHSAAILQEAMTMPVTGADSTHCYTAQASAHEYAQPAPIYYPSERQPEERFAFDSPTLAYSSTNGDYPLAASATTTPAFWFTYYAVDNVVEESCAAALPPPYQHSEIPQMAPMQADAPVSQSGLLSQAGWTTLFGGSPQLSSLQLPQRSYLDNPLLANPTSLDEDSNKPSCKL